MAENTIELKSVGDLHEMNFFHSELPTRISVDGTASKRFIG